jgi:hypothetical protein
MPRRSSPIAQFKAAGASAKVALGSKRKPAPGDELTMKATVASFEFASAPIRAPSSALAGSSAHWFVMLTRLGTTLRERMRDYSHPLGALRP